MGILYSWNLFRWVLRRARFDRHGLASISHGLSTAASDPGTSTALRVVGLLGAPLSALVESSRRAGWNAPDAPCLHACLRRLATKNRQKCGLVFALWLLGTPLLSGSEVDRLLVAVNGKVITEGDRSLARGLNEVLSYDPSAQRISRDSELDRLVNLELLRQELNNFSMTQDDESRVEARLQSLRDVYAGKGGLPPLLRKMGLQESELMAYLRLQSSIMKFVDFRFRPFVKVSEEEIKTYYEGRLAEQFQAAKLPLPALPQVSGRIEEILKEEKINTALDQWIIEVRHNSRIEYFNEESSF